MSSPKLTTTMTIRFVLLEHQYRETIKLCKYASYVVLFLFFYWHPVSNISLIKDAPNRKANDNETDFYWTTVVNQKFSTNNFQFTQRPHKNDIICNAREVDKYPTYGSLTTFLKRNSACIGNVLWSTRISSLCFKQIFSLFCFALIPAYVGIGKKKSAASTPKNR